MRFFAFSLERKDGILLPVSILIIKKEIDAYYYFRGRHAESNKTYSSVVKSTLIFSRNCVLCVLIERDEIVFQENVSHDLVL